MADPDPKYVSKSFTDLPIRELIAAPLSAAAESQMKLAQTQVEFIERIGFEEPGQDGERKARLVKFDLERPVDTGEGIETNKVSIQAPVLGLVPIPSLLVENVDIEFQMEVTSSTSEKSKTEAEAKTSVNYKSWFGVSASVNGKVSTSKENTRSTNQTAKYNVNVSAKQQAPTEGLSKLMDLLASSVAPIKIEKKAAA